MDTPVVVSRTLVLDVAPAMRNAFAARLLTGAFPEVASADTGGGAVAVSEDRCGQIAAVCEHHIEDLRPEPGDATANREERKALRALLRQCKVAMPRRKALSPEDARAYLADPANFFGDDESCYVCGNSRDWDAIESGGRMFCRAQCCNRFDRLVRRAKAVSTPAGLVGAQSS
jgi:hypothetical protein